MPFPKRSSSMLRIIKRHLASVALATTLMTLCLNTHASAQTTQIDFEQFSGGPFFTQVEPPLTVGVATFSGGQILSATSNLVANQSKVYGTAIFCSGCLPTITIDFSKEVSNFSVVLYNGQTFTVTYVVQDDQGELQSITLPAHFQSGFTTINLPSTGIRKVTITSDTGQWDFLIDNVRFDESGCTTNVQRLS